MITKMRKGDCILQKRLRDRARWCPYGISPHPGFSGRGSLSIEAALILPLFLFAALSLLSVMQMLTKYMDTQLKLYETARCAAVYGYAAAQGDLQTGDWIRLDLVYPARGRGGRFARTVLLENHVNVHVFNGYSGDDPAAIKQREEYVYITKDSEVYHRRRDCRHLKVSIRAVSGSRVSGERNTEGGRFYRCRYCSRGIPADYGGTVYVTDYGRLYHTRINCPDLKRTVSVIPLSQAGGRRPCKDCG